MRQRTKSSDNNEYFTYAAVRRIMSYLDCELVAKTAVNELRDGLQRMAVEITKKAMGLVNHRGDKKLTCRDITMAIEGVDTEIDTKRQVELLQQRLASLKSMIQNSERIDDD